MTGELVVYLTISLTVLATIYVYYKGQIYSLQRKRRAYERQELNDE